MKSCWRKTSRLHPVRRGRACKTGSFMLLWIHVEIILFQCFLLSPKGRSSTLKWCRGWERQNTFRQSSTDTAFPTRKWKSSKLWSLLKWPNDRNVYHFCLCVYNIDMFCVQDRRVCQTAVHRRRDLQGQRQPDLCYWEDIWGCTEIGEWAHN